MGRRTDGRTGMPVGRITHKFNINPLDLMALVKDRILRIDKIHKEKNKTKRIPTLLISFLFIIVV